jgi:hypothetical protein
MKRNANLDSFTRIDSFLRLCACQEKNLRKRRSNGYFAVLWQTIRKRLQAKLNEVRDELGRSMHDPIPEVGQLSDVNYYFPQDRCRCPATDCAAMAGGETMLTQNVEWYLAVRRAMGLALHSEGALLQSLAAFSEAAGTDSALNRLD